mmetsp:Transcript_12378/g.26780  ORF Transcript_12378/g.26780 Transcript_12378/m.26780 type:complete len:272 (-) Transcript_12378:1007-1822(-)
MACPPVNSALQQRVDGRCALVPQVLGVELGAVGDGGAREERAQLALRAEAARVGVGLERGLLGLEHRRNEHRAKERDDEHFAPQLPARRHVERHAQVDAQRADEERPREADEEGDAVGEEELLHLVPVALLLLVDGEGRRGGNKPEEREDGEHSGDDAMLHADQRRRHDGERWHKGRVDDGVDPRDAARPAERRLRKRKRLDERGARREPAVVHLRRAQLRRAPPPPRRRLGLVAHLIALVARRDRLALLIGQVLPPAGQLHREHRKGRGE